MIASNQPVFSDFSSLKTVAQLATTGGFGSISYDPERRCLRVRKARAWFAGQADVVRVQTDKGAFFLCIAQRVRLSSGGYVAAGDLKPGMSLHAVTVDLSQSYLRVKKTEMHFHRLAAAAAGHDITRMSVHHRDENKLNNRPENLEVMTQAEHARLHGKKEAEAGEHVFQKQRFSKSGDKNGMHSSGPFWKNSKKSSSYRETQGRILKSSGRASAMQAEAARQKRCNTAFLILNAGHPIDTFEQYYEGYKAVIGPVGHSKAHIKNAIDKAFGSHALFVEEVARRNHRVVAVEELGVADAYSVFVDSSCPEDREEADGNFLIMSIDATNQVGSGILVAGSAPPAVECLRLHPTQNPPLECANADSNSVATL